MDTMSTRSLTSGDFRLTANSVREITDALDALARRYGPEFKFQGRKLKAGPLLNAIALHFLLLPEAERTAILERSIPKLEKILESDGDVLAFMDRVDPRPPAAWESARDATPPRASRPRKRKQGS